MMKFLNRICLIATWNWVRLTTIGMMSNLNWKINMKAYYRKLESKKAGKVSWGTFRNAKRCAGLKKYIQKQKICRRVK